MSLLSTLSGFRRKAPTLYQVLSSDWGERRQILEPAVNLYCWERSLPGSLQSYLQQMLTAAPRPIKQALHRPGLEEDLRQARATWATLDSNAGAAAFWADVHQLCADFMELAGASEATLHLRLINHNACTKFHIDGYRLRLLSTYLGQGTEWLPEEAVNRAALGTTNQRIVRDPDGVQQLQAGQVAILKGEAAFAERRTRGIVHRSPQVAGTGEQRLVLRIDL